MDARMEDAFTAQEWLSDAKEEHLLAKQDETAAAIVKATSTSGGSEQPPRKPSDKDMADPKKMQEYMLQMGEYSARHRQQLKVMQIQQALGVTPRGKTIMADGVRRVVLVKETQQTRLGIIFHQNTPAELNDVSSDSTPRGGADTPTVVIPIIKVLDKTGIAGQVGNLFEGDQVLSVNGVAALSNIQAVQMLREAKGEVVLAVRETKITRTPRGTAINPNLTSGGLYPKAVTIN